ncbi:type I-E CRISPR-associated protein Cas7/Cse4/CasC [Ectothiorhodospiraceae bacterium BW-2]|nr:type I-E CRISPR-associated protein Cas7/Cse4/CasC [Ectothiorhodospiraceae bacterium BW-2]
MSLFIEYHLIQNFAPSNLNRDDTGAPKDALFGGHRRARISSQCFKRAMRLHTNESGTIPTQNQSIRTKKLKRILEQKLAILGREGAGERINHALSAAGLVVKDDNKTEYLLFLGEGEIDAFSELIDQHWDKLAEVEASTEKKSKKSAKAAIPTEIIAQAKKLLDGKKAVDVALYGRMLADLPEVNQHAACQVAHAISTHKVEREFDYFTAVDDRGDADETGAGMIGQIEFNAATLYRYAVIDVPKLVANLHDDTELALQAMSAFTQAIARAIPSGKQNSFAAHNPPAFVGVVLRHSSPFNLANAFEKPLWPKLDSELSALSVAKLAEQEHKIASFYGDGRDQWSYLDLSGQWPADLGTAQTHLDKLADWVADQVRRQLEG